MVLFIGEHEIYDFVSSLADDITYDIGIENASKLIVCDSSEQAFSAVRAAMLINIPVLGLLGGAAAVANVYSVKCENMENCAEGKQELAIIDADNPLFKGLETVIKICRGKPTTVIEASLPDNMKCIARSESGDIIAVACADAPVYAVNFHLNSGLTPEGNKIVKNFLDE